MAREGVVVDSSFPGRSFLGGGASDCGTLTIRSGTRPIDVSTADSLSGDDGVERGERVRDGLRRAVGS